MIYTDKQVTQRRDEVLEYISTLTLSFKQRYSDDPMGCTLYLTLLMCATFNEVYKHSDSDHTCFELIERCYGSFKSSCTQAT